MSSLDQILDQLDQSRREMIELKKQYPWLSSEGQKLQQAKQALEIAQARFDEAKALWEASEGGKGKP